MHVCVAAGSIPSGALTSLTRRACHAGQLTLVGALAAPGRVGVERRRRRRGPRAHVQRSECSVCRRLRSASGSRMARPVSSCIASRAGHAAPVSGEHKLSPRPIMPSFARHVATAGSKAPISGYDVHARSRVQQLPVRVEEVQRLRGKTCYGGARQEASCSTRPWRCPSVSCSAE